MTAASGSDRDPIPVLLYHRVAADDNDRFAVAPGRFSEQVRAIAATGRSPLTISELADCLRGARPLRAAPAAVAYLRDPGSRRNASRGHDFPRSLRLWEALGMVLGPFAYLASRSHARRVGAVP